ncbi:MAG: acyltransferase [Proteobacteria bacterium]|nr:acyltransferase [Pseudomonadota bacterium]
MTPSDSANFRNRARLPKPKRGLMKAAIGLRNTLLDLRLWWLRRYLGMNLHPGCRISLKANLDWTNPSGVHIDDGTYVAFGAVILAHDMSRVLTTDTHIGKNCFIGAHSIIMPGVRIGDHCIVATGAVVVQDVPPRSMVGGNPAKILRSDIKTGRWGILQEHFDAGYAEGAVLREAGRTKAR